MIEQMPFHHAGGTITDGVATISHTDAPAVLEQIDTRLGHAGVDCRCCVHLDLGNDVASVMLLMYALDRGLPCSLGARKADGTDPVARYCRWRIGAAPASLRTGLADLVITENTAWDGRAFEALPPRVLVSTSGSTGGRKTAAYNVAKLMRNASNCAHRLELTRTDRVAIPVPISHMYGLGAALLPALLSGADIDLLDGANVLRFLSRERAFEPTVAFLTPAFAEQTVRFRDRPRPYRAIVLAGDTVPPALFDRLSAYHGSVINLYGSSEAGVIAAGAPGDPPALRRETAGRLMPGVRLATPDAGDHELCFVHDWRFDGYVDEDGRVQETAANVYRPGDLGRMVGAGYLKVIGRADGRVKRDGVFVDLSAVEAVLIAAPGVERAVAVAGEDDTPRGRAIIAYCEMGAGATLDERAVRSYCRARLPSRAVPDSIIGLARLPVTPNGKLDRARLRGLRADAQRPAARG